MDRVREQYERYPYPPLSPLAVPRARPGDTASFEAGTRAAYGAPRSHDGIRILVAGAGTTEALGVAFRHPRAREVVAVDVSTASLARLGRRAAVARAGRWLRLGLGPRHAPVRRERADLLEWEGGSFDLVLASNVLHHVAEPAALLARLASWLAPGGVMRVVTYPKASRIWMRETGEWLKLNGVLPGTPNLVRRAREAVRVLPAGHPIRSCFESQPETSHEAGIVDAFLHARENPLSPLEWRDACARAGLRLAAEAQDEGSRSTFLTELCPRTASLDAWTRLQILDDLLELCANPVFWLAGGGTAPVEPVSASRELETSPVAGASELTTAIGAELLIPSRARWELGRALLRAERLLAPSRTAVDEVLARVRAEVGPRPLPGLSILDYDAAALRAAKEPWSSVQWERLGAALGPDSRLMHEGSRVPGATLGLQERWLQARFGPEMSEIPARIGRRERK